MEELIEHIEIETRLDWKPPSDKKQLSVRERLVRDAERGKGVDERLMANLSMAAEPLWELYWSIRLSKRGGLAGESVTYPDILAFSQLTYRHVSPWEVESIIALDTKRDEILSELEAKQRAKEQRAQRLEGRDSVQSRKTRR